MSNLYIILTIIAIIILFYYVMDLACHTLCNKTKLQNKHQRAEPFVDDYYSFNWVSPTLIDDINVEKVAISGRGCDCANKKNGGRCTYSMSCDYTDDTAHPACFAGHDMPGDGDLDVPPSFREFEHNHSI